MKKDVAISVNNVTKDFHLPRHKSDSLKQTITQVFKPKEKGVDVHHALKDISFEVKKGEFFGVLGRNGSGKSTLLKIISEIYKPTSGTVEHDGTLVSFIELGVGFKSELTGRENVYLNGALLGFSKKEIDSMYKDIVEFAELEKFMDQRLKNYSSGMKVRLAFSVAIRAKADILILDEVLAVGDAAFQKKCYEYFKSLKEDKSKTIVFVTHGMGAVKEYCDRAILIEDGVIQHEGEAADVADEYLKMFDNTKSREKKSKQSDIDKKGGLKIGPVSVEVSTSRVFMDVDIESVSVDTESLVIGVDLFRQGSLVGGVESFNCPGGQLISISSGESIRVRFVFDNIFGSGNYFVNVSAKSGADHTLYDFSKLATNFSNNNPKDYGSYFPVVLPVKLSLSRIAHRD